MTALIVKFRYPDYLEEGRVFYNGRQVAEIYTPKEGVVILEFEDGVRTGELSADTRVSIH